MKFVPDMTYNVFGGTLNPTLLPACPQHLLHDTLKDLVAYSAVNTPFACAATKTFMQHHLWYLSETLVGLAFFDFGIPSMRRYKW